MKLSQTLAVFALACWAVAATGGSSLAPATTLPTVEITVSDYTTYCSEQTVLVVTRCALDTCLPVTVSVSEPTTVTVSGTVVVASCAAAAALDSALEAAAHRPTETLVVPGLAAASLEPTYQSSTTKTANSTSAGTAPLVSTYDNSATKNIAGLVGVFAFLLIF